jgi:hypothetical protein
VGLWHRGERGHAHLPNRELIEVDAYIHRQASEFEHTSLLGVCQVGKADMLPLVG